MGETNRFNATLGVTNAPAASEAWEYIKIGAAVPEPLRTAVGDYIGAGNYWITNQAAFCPVGYKKEGANFVPINSGAPGDWPLETQAAMWGGERRSGDGGVPYANPRAVTVVPIPIPLGASGILTMSVAEYRSPASFKQATISHIAGDFTTPLSMQQGNTAAPAVTVGGNVQAGTTIYFNFRFWSPDLKGPSTDATPQGVTYGGGWPPLA